MVKSPVSKPRSVSLRTAGCDKIFAKQVSSVVQREQLELALDYVREGDQFVVANSQSTGKIGR